MNILVYLSLIYLIFLNIIHQGHSKRCYICLSNNDTNCKDNPQNTTIMDCKDFFRINIKTFTRLDDQNDFFCRKLINTVDAEEGEDKIRVARLCGILRGPEPNKCTKSVRVVSCECDGDLCNLGNHLNSKWMSFSIISLFMYYFLIY